MKKETKKIEFDFNRCCECCSHSRELYYPNSVEFGRLFYCRVGLTFCLHHHKVVEPFHVCKDFCDLPF